MSGIMRDEEGSGVMHVSKETRRSYLAMAAFLVLGCAFRCYSHMAHDVWSDALTFACHACLFFIWLRLMRRRFVRREVSSLLAALAALLLVWRFLQLAKYDLLYDVAVCNRYLWYAYYVPISFIPSVFLLAMLYVGMPRTWHMDRRYLLLLGVSGVLSLLSLTNDFHELAFRFKDGLDPTMPDWPAGTYTHGPVFYAVWTWAALVSALSLVVLIRRSVRSGLLQRSVIPLAIIVAMAVLLPAVNSQSITFLFFLFSYTELANVLMLAFCESLFVLGFFPANSGYDALWRASSLVGGFVDGHGQLCNLSAGAPDVTASQVREALESPLSLEEGQRELVALPVTGGTAFWVRDHVVVRRLSKQLEDLGDELSQEQAMLSSEIDLAHERETVARRQELYDQIVANTAPQLEALSSALERVPDEDDAFLAHMRRTAVYAAYIKRCANLTLLGEDGWIDVGELALSLGESCSCLRALGADAVVSIPVAGSASSPDALRVYAAFQEMVERALPLVRSVRVEGVRQGDELVVSLSVVGDACETLSLGVGLAGDAA